MKTIKWVLLSAAALLGATLVANALSAQEVAASAAKHRTYAVVVLPPDGGPDSLLAGYLFYAPLNPSGTLGVIGDTATPGVLNSYTWTSGEQLSLQPLPQTPNLTGTSTYINWINSWGLAAGYGTRTNPKTGLSYDNAAAWWPTGQISPLQTPAGGQSHAVWVNDFGQASGWIAPGSITDPCSFGVGLQSQAVVWQWGFGGVRYLGTLGGKNSYGEFINNRGQVSGHSQTSNVVNPNTGCPPFDPFVWQNGKMTDIAPGDFGGAEGGTNFLNDSGQAVGFADLYGDLLFHAFLWSDGKLTDLSEIGSLGADQDAAYNVNESGHVVGISITPEGTLFAVLWRAGAFTNLMSLSAEGDDCSAPTRINSKDQIVGTSFSCETGVSHAFVWENGQMQDLNALIPAEFGIALLGASWIDDNGVIAAQGVLTSGPDSGASRAVLLFPTSEFAAAPEHLNAAASSISATSRAKKLSPLYLPDGRVNPIVRRPFAPAKLREFSR
jgi:probable HAF family extracellular repeat protein